MPAFSLIELLVVIAIIVLLVSILLPALRGAREQARLVTEMAAAQQLMLAYHLYSHENKGYLFIGVGAESAVRDDQGRTLNASHASRYPFRLAPYAESGMRAFVVDRNLFGEFKAADDGTKNGTLKSQYLLSSHPTFGINYAINLPVGARHFKVQVSPSIPVVRTRADQIQHTSRLLVFASARLEEATLAADSGVIGLPTSRGAGARMLPGSYVVVPPLLPGQTASDDHYANAKLPWSPRHPAKAFGYLDLRWSSRSVVAFFDGHVSRLGVKTGEWEELRDMRHWYDQAATADWRPPPVGWWAPGGS